MFIDEPLIYTNFQAVIDAAHAFLPEMTVKRNEDLLALIRNATKRLEVPLDTIDKFVDHLTFLARLDTDMPAIDKEYFIVIR